MKRSIVLATILIVLAAQSGAAERVRVSVFGLFRPQQLVVEVSPHSPLLVRSGTKEFVAGVDSAQRITISRSRNAIVANSRSVKITGESVTVAARSGGDSEITLSIPGKLRRHYRGTLTVLSDGKTLVAVVEMDLETAVASVVAAEMNASAPLEALKAQAVVSRSYLVATRHRHPYSDFCDTTHCQFLREPPASKSRAAIATRETKGLVLKWNGRVVSAMFFASCGGRTHSLAEVGYQTADYPYYSVECPYCHGSPERWSSRISNEDAAKLAPKSESERIKAGRKLGWHAVESNAYTRTSRDGAVDLTGVGRGHGVGMCQRGAIGMAQSGKQFRAILAHYLPNTTIGDQ